MKRLEHLIGEYLEYCRYRKGLDEKTLKAYSIDLKQFQNWVAVEEEDPFSKPSLIRYITCTHKQYKPETIKRKIASVKAFCHYLEYEEILQDNPFHKIDVKFREPQRLPKTIPFHMIQMFIAAIYRQKRTVLTEAQRRTVLRDIAVVELLFATGVRISELCSLKPENIDFNTRNLLIYGKGSKERMIQIGNEEEVKALREYKELSFIHYYTPPPPSTLFQLKHQKYSNFFQNII